MATGSGIHGGQANVRTSSPIGRLRGIPTAGHDRSCRRDCHQPRLRRWVWSAAECGDTRQGLAFKPFQERTASGRYIADPVRHAGMAQCRHGITTARNAEQRARLSGFSHGLGQHGCGSIEGRGLERPQRAIPYQRLQGRQTRHQGSDAGRTHIKDHGIGGHRRHRDHRNWRVGAELLGCHARGCRVRCHASRLPAKICPRGSPGLPGRCWPWRRR